MCCFRADLWKADFRDTELIRWCRRTALRKRLGFLRKSLLALFFSSVMTLSIFSIDLGLCLSLERGQERDLVRDLDARLDGIQLHVLTGIQQWQRIYHPPQRHRSGRWPIHDGEGPVGDEFISSQVSGQASWRAATCEWFSTMSIQTTPPSMDQDRIHDRPLSYQN